MKKVIFLTLLALTACTDIEVQRGAELKQEKIDRITPESNKGDVINLLGSPSAKSSYGDETWYYIYNKRERNIIGSDEVLEQDVLQVTFNKDDKVSTVKLFDESNAAQVEFSDKKTNTAGHELTVMEQILGNIGKFNKEGDAKGSRGSRVPGG